MCKNGLWRSYDAHVFGMHSVSVAQWLEHCVNSAKAVGSIPREHIY